MYSYYKKIIFIVMLHLSFFQGVCYANQPITFQITGVQGEILENIKARLHVWQNSSGHTASIVNTAEEGKKEIKKAMQPFGYFSPGIYFQIHKQNYRYTISYFINKGPSIKIVKLDIKLIGNGKDNPVLNAFISHFPIKLGDRFNIDNYNKAKAAFVTTANEAGYIKGFFKENKILVNTKAKTALIILHFQTGSLYKFGPITINSEYYSHDFLHRFIDLDENEPFSSQKVMQLQQKLAHSYYFQQADLTPQFDHISENKVPIQANLVPPKSQRYSLGFGYSSLTGPRLIAGMNLRRLTNTGQHFDAQLKLSSVLSAVVAKYYIPANKPLTDLWVLGFDYQYFLPQNGRSMSTTLSGGYLRKEDHYQLSTNLNYLVERYKVDDYPQKFNKLLYPDLNINYVAADDLIHPTSGKSFNLIVRGSSEHILSSTDFIQGEIKAKYLFSPTNVSHIILRGDIGYTVVHDLNNLPLSLRFFAGGTNSIRGYADSSIGPGKFLKVGSIEFQNHIKGNWTGAVFFDAGTASNQWQSALNRGTGVGIIYNSAVGPIKVYLAKALDRHSKQYSVELSIGPEF